MRQKRIIWGSLFDLFSDPQIGRDLTVISAWRDAQCWLVALVATDVSDDCVKQTGRQSLPAESVLRCALLKQFRQLSYEELAFHLPNSSSFQAFARLPLSLCPKKSLLQKTISLIRAETWEQINQAD